MQAEQSSGPLSDDFDRAELGSSWWVQNPDPSGFTIPEQTIAWFDRVEVAAGD